jgi:hypothetical protein
MNKHFTHRLIPILFVLVVSMLFISQVNSIRTFAIDGVTQETLDSLNPLEIVRGSPEGETIRYGDGPSQDLNTPAGILNRVIIFAFPIAIAILFVMLIWAGFEMFSGSANKSSLESGKKRATMAIGGFLLLFVSYWLIQLIEAIFGIKIFT